MVSGQKWAPKSFLNQFCWGRGVWGLARSRTIWTQPGPAASYRPRHTLLTHRLTGCLLTCSQQEDVDTLVQIPSQQDFAASWKSFLGPGAPLGPGQRGTAPLTAPEAQREPHTGSCAAAPPSPQLAAGWLRRRWCLGKQQRGIWVVTAFGKAPNISLLAELHLNCVNAAATCVCYLLMRCEWCNIDREGRKGWLSDMEMWGDVAALP